MDNTRRNCIVTPGYWNRRADLYAKAAAALQKGMGELRPVRPWELADWRKRRPAPAKRGDLMRVPVQSVPDRGPLVCQRNCGDTRLIGIVGLLHGVPQSAREEIRANGRQDDWGYRPVYVWARFQRMADSGRALHLDWVDQAQTSAWVDARRLANNKERALRERIEHAAKRSAANRARAEWCERVLKELSPSEYADFLGMVGVVAERMDSGRECSGVHEILPHSVSHCQGMDYLRADIRSWKRIFAS